MKLTEEVGMGGVRVMSWVGGTEGVVGYSRVCRATSLTRAPFYSFQFS